MPPDLWIKFLQASGENPSRLLEKSLFRFWRESPRFLLNFHDSRETRHHDSGENRSKALKRFSSRFRRESLHNSRENSFQASCKSTSGTQDSESDLFTIPKRISPEMRRVLNRTLPGLWSIFPRFVAPENSKLCKTF